MRHVKNGNEFWKFSLNFEFSLGIGNWHFNFKSYWIGRRRRSIERTTHNTRNASCKVYIYISCIKDFSYDECQASWMDESMANNLLITLSTSKLDIYYTNPVAFHDWIHAIKITKWQITNAIVQSVKYAVFILISTIYVCSLLS